MHCLLPFASLSLPYPSSPSFPPASPGSCPLASPPVHPRISTTPFLPHRIFAFLQHTPSHSFVPVTLSTPSHPSPSPGKRRNSTNIHSFSFALSPPPCYLDKSTVCCVALRCVVGVSIHPCQPASPHPASRIPNSEIHAMFITAPAPATSLILE